MLSSNAVLNRF